MSTTGLNETTGDRDSLTPEQLDAVKAYAQDHGIGWKESLRSDWMRGGSNWGGPYHLLQQIRNQHGPRWLTDFRLGSHSTEYGKMYRWLHNLCNLRARIFVAIKERERS